MPYTMMIFPDEKIEIPKVGQRFKVTDVVKDIIDFHWGKGTHIELQLEEVLEETDVNAITK